MFYPKASERYKLEGMSVNDITLVTEAQSAQYEDTFLMVQRHVSAYAQRAGKKFKTKTHNGTLYIKRIS